MDKTWKRVCAYGLDLIQITSGNIISGDISANELITISSREQKLLRIVSFVCIHNLPEPDVLKTEIGIRNEEYNYFVSFKQKLIFIASKIAKSELDIEGQSYLSACFINSVP